MHNKLSVVVKLSIIFFLVFLSQVFFTNISVADSQNVEVSSKVLPQVSSPVSLPDFQKKSIERPTPRVASVIPAPPEFDVRSYILIDANSGYIIAEKNANQQVYPASLTKLMALYLIASALRSGQFHLNDQVNVSKKAWRMAGARMFIKVGTAVSAQDLIKGVVVASGNDATVAMAEHLSGTEQAFVDLMNQAARSLKMTGTNYAGSTGWPHADNYSTAFDLAILTRAWILNFPEYYSWFKEKWFVYNGIKQPNRNRLLWRDSSVDGVKTGVTDEAGYCSIASAIRGDTRLIAVMMGAKSDTVRTKYVLALLNYGFHFFESRKLFSANTSLVTPKILLGKENTSALGLKEDLYVTIPKGEDKSLKAKAEVDNRLKAPITKGNIYGKLNVSLDGNLVATKPLVALKDNPRANFLFAIFDYIVMLFHK